ncbi:homoserine kinase [Alkalihalobacillus sp. NPDC078783]
MEAQSFQIKVPGSTANLGPGFDSIGLAVSRYLELEVTTAGDWYFSSDSKDLKGIPTGVDNLVYQVAKQTAEQLNCSLPPCHVKMTSNIPLARGLGSSAAAIVAGIELACYFSDEEVAAEKKTRMASLWEGHPDNVAASVYGGLVIGTHHQDLTRVVQAGIPKLDLVFLIPTEEVLTKTARGVLPESLDFSEAVQAGSVGNVLTAAALTGNWELVGEMMSRDLYHQPYRKQLIPIMDKVITFAETQVDIYGAALSGAGPTILCITKEGMGVQVAHTLTQAFEGIEVDVLKPSKKGVQLIIDN